MRNARRFCIAAALVAGLSAAFAQRPDAISLDDLTAAVAKWMVTDESA